MDDFSKYIKNPSEFMLNYQINDNKIIVNIKKNLQIYKLSKSKIKYFEKKLEQQYKTIINKQDDILQNELEKKIIVYMIIAMTTCILSAVSSEISEILGMMLCGVSTMTLIINAIDNALYTIKFKSKIKLYDIYLKERKNIEASSSFGNDIAKHFNKDTQKEILLNQQLKSKELTENIFTINLMDKISLQELKKLIYIYSINNDLEKKYIDNNVELKIMDLKQKAKKRIKRKG